MEFSRGFINKPFASKLEMPEQEIVELPSVIIILKDSACRNGTAHNLFGR